MEDDEFQPLNTEQIQEKLSEIYLNPKIGLHSDPNRLFQKVRKFGISYNQCVEFIRNQKNWQLHYHHPRNTNEFFKIKADYYQHQCQIDLIDHQKYSNRRENKNCNWIMVVIDIWSRKVFLRPLKNKMAISTRNALEDIFKEYLPENVRTDGGGEFFGEFKELLNDSNIKHWITNKGDHNLLGVVDRFCRTFRTLLESYWTAFPQRNGLWGSRTPRPI
jgi:hypothetical protein